MEAPISDEDGKLALEIFKQALSFRPQIKKAILGEALLALPEEERLKERLTPRISISYFGDNKDIPSLYLRLNGIMLPVVEVFFYPFEAICSFLDTARLHVEQVSSPERPDEEKEKAASDRALEMTLIMIDSVFQRTDLMTDSFISEVITQWHIQNRKNFQNYYAGLGNPIPRQKDNSMEDILKIYNKELLRFWKYQGQGYESAQKINLAEEYEVVYEHWKLLSKTSRENENWRQYAKAGIFEDTPDDLLDKLENTDRLNSDAVDKTISELAIEHAARRVRLIKKSGVSESALNQRKKGIRVTDFTSTYLFILLGEGRELLAQFKEAEAALEQEEKPLSLESDGDST
jgi:hypothetical protein